MNISILNRLIYLGLFLASASDLVYAQEGNMDFRKLTLQEGYGYPPSSMELLPDKNTVVIGTSQGPLYLWDLAGEKMIKKIDVVGYRLSGPRITVSKDGKMLLLEQQYYNDFNLNKDKAGKVEVLELESSKVILKRDNVHDAEITPDGKLLLTLAGSEVEVADIQTGKKIATIPVESASNALTISPDGKTMLVSHKLRKEDLAYIPSVRDDKRSRKSALKFRETVSFYEFPSGKKLMTINDLFDIIYSMRFSADGQRVFVYNVANTKLQQQAGGGAGARQGYVSQINPQSGKVLRTVCSSMAPDPDYKESPDNRYLGVASAETDYKLVPTLLLYDLLEGDILHKFEENVRLFTEKSLITPVYFVFYPTGDKVLLSYGGKLCVWNLNK